MKYPRNCVAPIDYMDVCGGPKKTNTWIPPQHVSTRSVEPKGGKPQPVAQLDMDGNIIAKFKSIANASIVTGVDQWSINKATKGKIKSAGGTQWRMLGEDEVGDGSDMVSITRGMNGLLVVQMDEMRNRICVFASATAAANSIGADPKGVRRALKSGAMYHGFYWSVKMGDFA